MDEAAFFNHRKGNDFFQIALINTRVPTFMKIKMSCFKAVYSVTFDIFRFFFYFLFKSLVKVELSYAFTINLFTIAENCTEKWIIL